MQGAGEPTRPTAVGVDNAQDAARTGVDKDADRILAAEHRAPGRQGHLAVMAIIVGVLAIDPVEALEIETRAAEGGGEFLAGQREGCPGGAQAADRTVGLDGQNADLAAPSWSPRLRSSECARPLIDSLSASLPIR